MATWRKTREGAWAVFGPVEEIATGTVRAIKRDGTARMVEVIKMSAPFDVRGVKHAYGYVKPRREILPSRDWRPCGYPGCNPSTCDECDGRGLQRERRNAG